MVLEPDKREATTECIGSAIGKFVKIGRPSLRDRQRSILRLRVEIDVELPLRRNISFKPSGERSSVLYDLEYERLPFFCLFCGLVSHVGSNCPNKTGSDLSEPRYSILLNAERKERWIKQQEEEEFRVISMVGLKVGSRFGLHTQKTKGWVMKAPELPTIGFGPSREEMEEVQSAVGVPVMNGMDVDGDETSGRSECLPLAKRQRCSITEAEWDTTRLTGEPSLVFQQGPEKEGDRRIMALMNLDTGVKVSGDLGIDGTSQMVQDTKSLTAEVSE